MKRAFNTKNELIEINQIRMGEDYFCPQCMKKVTVCFGEIKKPYFAHQKLTKHIGNNETDCHQKGKDLLVKYFIKKHLIPKTEFYLKDTKQRADIFINNNIIEYQCSPISITKIKQRQQKYHNLGFNSFWIAGPRFWHKTISLNTLLKFGFFNDKYQLCLLYWDALNQASPILLNNILISALGKLKYQKMDIFYKQKYQIYFNEESLLEECFRINHKILGNKMDLRYIDVQKKCYQEMKNIMGAPLIVHFPRQTNDLVNNMPPILNRINFLLNIEHNNIAIDENKYTVDKSFLQLLLKNKYLVINNNYLMRTTKKLKWYEDFNEKSSKIKKDLENLIF